MLARDFSKHLLHRLFAEDGHAPQQAPLARRKNSCARATCSGCPTSGCRPGARHARRRTSAAPGDQRASADRVAFLPRQAVDRARHQAVDIERLASRCRMRAHHGMPVRRLGIVIVRGAQRRIRGVSVECAAPQETCRVNGGMTAYRSKALASRAIAGAMI
jgi:hypothetical protein